MHSKSQCDLCRNMSIPIAYAVYFLEFLLVFLYFPVVVTFFRVAERIYVVNIVSVKWI